MFFRFFGPLLLLLPPDLDLLKEDDVVEEAGALADEEAAEVEAVAPCRACRINLSTTRNVRGSSMSTFSSTLYCCTRKRNNKRESDSKKIPSATIGGSPEHQSTLRRC